MPSKDCFEKFKGTDLHLHLKNKLGQDYNPQTGEGKEQFIKAAMELQEQSINSVKDVYSKVGIKGYEKSNPNETTNSQTNSPDKQGELPTEKESQPTQPTTEEVKVPEKGEEPPIGEPPAKVGDPLRKLAETIRSGKINKLGGFKTTTGFDAVWDSSLEVVAKSIEGGAKIADAIEAGIKHIKETDWYKELTDKSKFEQDYREHLNNELGGGKEPPAEPPKKSSGGDGKGKLDDKGILNHLYNAEKTPSAAKEGFKEKGLKYVVASQKEAEGVAKGLIDEVGIEQAVLIAETGKLKGGVNSAVFAESLNRLSEQELSSKTPTEQLDAAKRFAEIGMRYDEFSREQGRDISQINYFYKKSPLGIQMMENAKRAEDFTEWSKKKDQSWKEYFDEMMKEPEFSDVVKLEIKEGMKKERQDARKERVKKVDEFFDKAKDQFKGGAAYSTIIPPQIITTALEGMKKAYHAGEKVAELVENAIDYISEQIGNASWDKEKFRTEWQEKLRDKDSKKEPLTPEQLKERFLKNFRKKLKGLTDKQKEEVVRKSFKKIVESGGLDYADFKKIIAEATGRSEMTAAEAKKLGELVKRVNAVEEAAEKARTERTPKALKDFRQAEIEAGKASKELSDFIGSKPNIIKRLTSIMQLNTLGIPALVNNPIYNLWNQSTLRFPIGVFNTVLDQAIAQSARVVGKKYSPETNILRTQGEFWRKLGLGSKEAGKQFFTGLNRLDYTQKEIHGQQIRPLKSIRDLWDFAKGNKNLTKTQVADKALQGTVGIPAEIVARLLNLGDKPQRFAAEGSKAAAFAKALNLKDIDYKLFIEFPREEAYRVYKSKGLSDAEAAKKADYIKDIVIKEGQRSTFQQDNMLNDMLNKVFGGEQSGVGSLAKAVLVSPYIKIPANAYWSYYNLVNPEVAVLQSMIYGAKAISKRGRNDNSSAKDLHESRYWLAHAAVGIATRAVITSLVVGGVYTPSQTGTETKKEREGENTYEPQGTVNITKLAAMLQGKDPSKVKGGITASNKWFGQLGSVGNTIASRYESMTPEQREAGEDYWDMVLGNLTESSLKEMQQGIFSNTSTLLSALNGNGGNAAQRFGISSINMAANIFQPAAVSQFSKAELPYYSTTKAEGFGKQLENSMLQRSSVIRSLTGKYPPAKIGIWGDVVDRPGNVLMRLFGFNNTTKDNFAQPLYEDYKRTGDISFFPPSVQPRLNNQPLTPDQALVLEKYVGQARKQYIAPFINDDATIDGYDVKYSKLNDEEKKYVLSYIYELGRDDGVAKFEAEFPEFKKLEVEPDYESETKREVFRLLQKYKNK